MKFLEINIFLFSFFATTILYAQTTLTSTASPFSSLNLSPGAATLTPVSDEKTPLGREASHIYNVLRLGELGLAYGVFKKAFIGYYNIKGSFNIKKPVLTIIDFDKPSTEKRMWVVDLGQKKILQNCLVAHGKQSGENMAVKFSNDLKSSASSLGFYVTLGTYNGKNGYSLQLEGIDEGFNTNAKKRAVVMHGAWYVSEKFIKTYGRLGRSWGCPAIPLEIAKDIIDEICRGSVLFINKSDSGYQSKYLD